MESSTASSPASQAKPAPGVTGESGWDGIVVVGNQTYTYNLPALVLTPFISTSGSVVFNVYLGDTTGYGDGTYSNAQYTATNASGFMNHEQDMWNVLGADQTTGLVGGVLINVRPGITVKNSGGDINILGDSINPKGIDLSGSAYAGSVLANGDTQTLNGHFGQYDEPIVLSLRAAGNLNFGSYVDTGSTDYSSLAANLHLGTLSDGFSQYSGGLNGSLALGAGASAWAAPFDPAASGQYDGRSGGLGADSATYFLTAGADVASADPLKTAPNAIKATVTVAGVTSESGVSVNDAFTVDGSDPVTTDPLYFYNYSWSGGNTTTILPTDWLGGTSLFADYASIVRTGTGNIAIAAGKDLVLQSPLSLIYTAGTGYNVNGSSSQPLSGFTQYNGQVSLAGTTAATTNAVNYLPPSTYLTHGGDVKVAVGGNIVGDMMPNTFSGGAGVDDQDLPYEMTALGSQLKLQNFGSSQASATAVLVIGSFSSLYATDDWIRNNATTNHTYYTMNGLTADNAVTPGTYQLAWYTWFPYLENSIGSFGGGNITAAAGGNISRVQFVAPTNARDAGPTLVATHYDPVAQTGLYVQGGGNINLTANGDITNVYTYAQNGKTVLQAGGSVGAAAVSTSRGDPCARNDVGDVDGRHLGPGSSQHRDFRSDVETDAGWADCLDRFRDFADPEREHPERPHSRFHRDWRKRQDRPA